MYYLIVANAILMMAASVVAFVKFDFADTPNIWSWYSFAVLVIAVGRVMLLSQTQKEFKMTGKTLSFSGILSALCMWSVFLSLLHGGTDAVSYMGLGIYIIGLILVCVAVFVWLRAKPSSSVTENGSV